MGGGGKSKSFTMRFFLKAWEIADPIMILSNGKVSIQYTGNPAILPYEFPQELQKQLKQIFNHSEEKRWPTIPIESQDDVEKIKKVLDLSAKYASHSQLVWEKRRDQ